MDSCASNIKKEGNMLICEECDQVLDWVLDQSMADGKPCLNPFDIRLKDEENDKSCGMKWPRSAVWIKNFLNKNQKLFNAPQMDWTECSDPVYSHLSKTKEESTAPIIEKLSRKFKVLMIAGDKDLICNHVGIKKSLQKIIPGLKNTVEEELLFNNRVYGTQNTYQNLRYVRLYNTSHMVPIDVPEEFQHLVAEFISLQQNDFSLYLIISGILIFAIFVGVVSRILKTKKPAIVEIKQIETVELQDSVYNLP